MLKIIHENREQERQFHIERLNDPNTRRTGLSNVLEEGKEYWLRVEITDAIDADIIIRLMYSPDTVEGSEHLGFAIRELTVSGVARTDDMKQRIIDFANSIE